jgi:hypothetical protein
MARTSGLGTSSSSTPKSLPLLSYMARLWISSTEPTPADLRETSISPARAMGSCFADVAVPRRSGPAVHHTRSAIVPTRHSGHSENQPEAR